jgi:hypothetical protein
LQSSILNYHQDRVVNKEGAAHRMMAGLLQGVKPEFAVTDPSGKPVAGIETHTFHNGGARIVALHSNPELRIDELGPPEFKSNDRFAKPATVTLHLGAAMHAYDIRGAKSLGRIADIKVTVDGHEPSIFAISPTPFPELEMSSPTRIARGSTATLGVRFAGSTPAARHVLHVDVVDPSGSVIGYYSGNLLAPEGRASKSIPFALSDMSGRWEVRVKDLLTGQQKTSALEVF